jgi:CBS domain-containing protein
MKVREIMTRDPVTIDPEAPLGTAAAVMRERRIRHLPVLDEAGTLVGIVTDRDVRAAALMPSELEGLSAGAERRLRGARELLERLPVRAAMTQAVATTHPDATLAQAAAAMVAGRHGSLPVIEDGRLVGIVTELDLLRSIVRLEPELSHDLERYFLW